ncbi:MULTISPECIES: hypothetical protein [unclassified Lacrimispora]|uniref:hypothetical protein n=1 Tax=unclassified Lacrimispora TaxID=2719232 RepID=UPI00376F9D5F
MKQYVTYICEKCSRESRNADEIRECEASHLGLTIDEKLEYDVLQEIVRRRSYTVSVTKNEKTDKEFEDAIIEMLAFERKHGIIK